MSTNITMKRIFIPLMLILFVSCQGEETAEISASEDANEPVINANDSVQEVYPTDVKFNEFAQFIAGYEGSPSSSLKSLEESNTWKNYQDNLEVLWKKTNNKLPVIREWADNELNEINQDGGTLFYPFSGADFLHADLFFSGHDHIAMMALEPIGTFPELQNAPDTTVNKYLARLKKSMNAILGLSFFRTIAMADDFKSELDGTLHVLVHFMARTDHEVLFQEQVAILPDGQLTNDLSAISDSTYVGNRFYFKKQGSDKVKTLTYFAANVQDKPYHSRGGLVAKGLETRTDLVAYFKQLNIKTTYLKSASYLMHRPTFSIIRSTILDESEYVLQDDSGIPVGFFDESKWNLTFYGNYSFPISLFAERHQEDLKEIYAKKEKTVKPLPFGIGYQYHVGTSNMMLAEKK